MSPKVKQNVTRREQVKKAGSTVFSVVAIASVLVVFSVVSIRFLWEKKSYNDRVIKAKREALKSINANIESLDKLAEQFPALEDSQATNSKAILRALPPVYDYAALASSIDYLATMSGVTSSTNLGTDISSTAVKSAVSSQPIELPLTLSVEGDYDKIKTYILNLERSIRPIHIKKVTYTGTSGSLKASIEARTYYQPVRTLDVTKEQVK